LVIGRAGSGRESNLIEGGEREREREREREGEGEGEGEGWVGTDRRDAAAEDDVLELLGLRRHLI
jgi:hypothetical protein